MSNYFKELADVDCSKNIEKKGNFSYLSWAFAVGELLSRHPDSTWTVYEYEGIPYCETKAGCFVKVGVTVNGIERCQVHPVLGQNNKTVKEPDAFQINTSIQRCLTKAIALHGLGLSIYQGEDVPNGDGHDEIRPEKPVARPTPKAWLSAYKVTPKTPAFAKLVSIVGDDKWESAVKDFLDKSFDASTLADLEAFAEYVEWRAKQ